MKRKSLRRGSECSVKSGKIITDMNYQDQKDSIHSLRKVVTEGLATIRADMDKLRHELKSHLNEVRERIKV